MSGADALTGLVATALAVLLLGCSASDGCADLPVPDGDCADLTFSSELYDEWAPAELPAITQELGDAAFPACNDDEPCNGPDLDGHGATDVWLLEGVDPQHALMGYRQGTRTPVIYLRHGLTPERVPGLAAYAN